MAKQVIALEATLNSGPAEGSVKSLKAQLREAQAEVAAMADKFGETSKEVENAARKAAQLKDKIGDAKALTEAFNPDKKFNAFAGALQGVVGGFAAAQGAMALFGAESEDVEKMMLKVNAAMAMVQGLNAISASIDSFKELGIVLRGNIIVQKAVTAAQWLWNAAMAANPIGAIVAVVAALIAGIVALTKYMIDNSNANKQMAAEVAKSTKALEAQTKAYQKNSDELERQQNYTLSLAKAKGATTAEIRKLETKLMDEKVAHLENARQIAVNTFETEKNTLAKYKSAGATDEVIKKQRELTAKALEEANKITGDLNKSLVERVELQRKHNVEVTQENTNAATKARDAKKQANAQAAEDLKKANEDARKQTQKLAEENLLLSIKDERKRQEAALQIQYENQQLEIERSKANRKDKDAELLALENNFLLQTAALRQKFADEDAKKKQENDAKLLENEKEMDKIMLQLMQENADEAVKIEKAAAQQKKDIQDATFGALDAGVGFLKEISGKNKSLQKAAIITENAIGIAKQIIANQTANAGALATPQAIATSGASAVPVILRNNIRTALGVATTIAATAKALSSLGGGSAPSGGNPNAGGGGGGGVTAPVAPQLGQTALNQQMINQTGNASVRAFVLETDVSGNQERIRRLNRAARIN